MTTTIHRILLLLGSCLLSLIIQAQTWIAPVNTVGYAGGNVELHGSNGYLTLLPTASSTGVTYFDAWGAQTLNGNFSMDLCKDFKCTPDNGHVFIGSIYGDTTLPDYTPVLVKLQGNGQVSQSHVYPLATYGKDPMSVRPTLDGGYVFLSIDGVGQPAPHDYNMQLTKVDSLGTPIWTHIYGDSLQQVSYAVRPTPDGGYLIVGAESPNLTSWNLHLVKVDGAGTVQWSRTYPQTNHSNSVRTTQDGGFVISYYIATGAKVSKLDALGNIEWTYTVPNGNNGALALQRSSGGYAVLNGPEMILLDTVGNVLSSDSIVTSAYSFSRWGAIAWNITYGDFEETNDGGFILGGVFGTPFSTPIPLMIKTDGRGRVRLSTLEGVVYEDRNGNCQYNGPFVDNSRSNIIVTATNSNGQQWHATTDMNGVYNIPVPLGTYTLSTNLGQANPYVAACGVAPIANITNDSSIITNDLGYNVRINCPYLTVSLEPNLLRIGVDSSSIYSLNYCNNGTDTAQSAYVNVSLDSAYVLQGSSVPYATQQGLTYTFLLGNLAPGDCGTIYLYGMIQAGTPLGQVHCSEVQIYPDSSCLPLTEPNIEASTECQGPDTLWFILENIGASMTTAMPYNIFEDHLMMRQGYYQLNSGERDTIIVPTVSGRLYRIEAIPTSIGTGVPTQQGQRLAWAFGSACQTQTVINWSNINTFYTGHNVSSGAISCRANQGSWDPNDKMGYPLGYGNRHQISPNLPLTYKIRFQNTGTDTAFRVVILDTLSPLLNPTTLRMQATSHPMRWTLHGGNILEIIYSPMELPDSNVNEPASHGFVTFQIDHIQPLALPSVIENTAAIYFDANAPIITNTTLHTVDTNYRPILVHVDEPLSETVDVKVYPNPFYNQATIEVLGGEGRYTTLTLEVYNVLGHQIEQQQSNTHQFTLERGDRTEGVYFYRIRHGDELINTGRLIIGQ